MNRTDRLTGIILALQRGPQTAGRLAERFEVSRRTILRDVDALGEIGVPVVSTPGMGGGLALAEGYWLPPLHLSAAEAAVLLLAVRGLGDPAASPFGEAGRTAEEKLRAALRPDVLAEAEQELADVGVVRTRRPADPAHVQALREAIRRERWVRVEYQSLRRVATHLLLPTGLHTSDGRWYCRAISLDAGEERTYRLDRMQSVEPAPTPEGAEEARRAAARPRQPYDDPSHPEVVVRLTYQGARLAEDVLDVEVRPGEVAPGVWELRFRCPPSELPYYARGIYALGPTAEAVAPPGLRARVRDLAVAAADRYADGT